jgi:conjugal transfer/type IV secretion protein DotA/TraY
MLFIAGAMMGLAGIVQAQGSVPNPSLYLNATSDSDASASIFRHLVGDFFLNPLGHMGGTQSLMGTLFFIFNGFVFLIAVLWMSYGMIFKVVQTATKGEVMGSNMSNAWLPIRWITGIAGIVPIFGGFSLSQVLLVAVAALGIGVANLSMNGILTATANFQGLLSPAVGRTTAGVDFDELARGIFATRVCARAVAEEQASSAASGAPFPRNQLITEQPVRGALNSYAYGTNEVPSLCGGASVHRSDEPVRQQDGITAFLSFRVNSVNYDAIASQVQTAYASGFTGFKQSIQALADEWYDRRRTNAAAAVDLQRMRSMVALYATSVANGQNEANIYASGQDQAITQEALRNMREVGWFGLGSWYSTFAEVNAALADASKSIELRVTPPDLPRLRAGVLGEGSELANSVEHALSSMAKAEQVETNVAAGQSSGVFAIICRGLGLITETGNCSLGQKVVEMAIGSTAAGSGGGDLVNPIIMFKNMGDYSMVVGQTIIGVMALLNDKVASWIGAALGAIGGAGAGAAAGPVAAGAQAGFAAAIGASIGKILPTLGVLLFTLGALMALYIPMIPFITWMGGLIQYAVVVVEGLVGMPIAALSHIDSEGEGLGSRTERGYIFLLNVCFRPVLMVFGFIAASALVIALGTLQAKMFMPAMASLQGNSVTGMASIVGLLVIFFVMNVTLIQGLFNMIFLLPDQVLGLIGNGNTDPIGRETEDKVNRLFMAGAYVAREMGPAAMAKPGSDRRRDEGGQGRAPGAGRADVSTRTPGGGGRK